MKKIAFIATAAIASALLMMNCSGKNDQNDAGRNSTSYTYTTTSNVGDYSEWTFDGTTVGGSWKVINSVGTIDYTYNLSASCATYNSTYNYYTCSISSSACTEGPGAAVCNTPPSGTFRLYEEPNAMIMVQTDSGTNAQLHIGFVRDSTSCLWNIGGDYVFTRTGLGNNTLFGIYRSDGDFDTLTKAEFTMKSVSSTSTPSVQYLTELATGAGSDSYSDLGCDKGLRTRMTGLPAETIRAAFNRSGFLTLDFPSGKGGLVGFKTTRAATINDLANKTFGGIYFLADGSLQDISLSTGSTDGNIVSIAGGDLSGAPLASLDIRRLDYTPAASVLPNYPDFTSGVSNTPTSGYPYSNNALSTTYGTAGSIPGLFRLDGFSTTQTRFILAATKFGEKVLVFGAAYKWQNVGDTPPNGVTYTTSGLNNLGNFIFFER